MREVEKDGPEPASRSVIEELAARRRGLREDGLSHPELIRTAYQKGPALDDAVRSRRSTGIVSIRPSPGRLGRAVACRIHPRQHSIPADRGSRFHPGDRRSGGPSSNQGPALPTQRLALQWHQFYDAIVENRLMHDPDPMLPARREPQSPLQADGSFHPDLYVSQGAPIAAALGALIGFEGVVLPGRSSRRFPRSPALVA